MQLHVVFDRSGKILAAAQVDIKSELRVRPIAVEKDGHRVAEIEVPPDVREHRLADLCKKMVVETDANGARLRPISKG